MAYGYSAYKDSDIADILVFALADGLTWADTGGRTFAVKLPELCEWIGNRAEAGRLPSSSFPTVNRFT